MNAKIPVIAAALVLAASIARAAGVDSRTMTCGALHSLIAQAGYLFISEPAFGDFVVANAGYCQGGDYVQIRSVPTLDAAWCPINYCVSSNFSGLH